MSRFLFVLGLLCSCSSLFGQEQFRAIITQGRAYLTTPRGFHQIAAGELLSDTSKIEMVDNTLLTLMDSKGRLLNLNSTGKFDLGTVDLSQNPDSSRLVYDLWTAHYERHSPVNMDEELTDSQTKPSLFLPSSSETSLGQVLLTWHDTGALYELQLLDEFEEVFHVFKSNRPFLRLDLLAANLVWKRQVFLRVVDVERNEKSGLYALRKLSPPDADYAEGIVKRLSADENLTSLLTLSLFYEDRRWIADVHSLLFSPARTDENVRAFYFDFLDRNGFNSLKRQFHK